MGRWKIQRCEAESLPKIFVSRVSGPPKRRFASSPLSAAGEIVGATLGNDVNLRDFEGRSALLLGKAKDNNASCALGPFVRLFDDHFDIDSVRTLDVSLDVQG